MLIIGCDYHRRSSRSSTSLRLFFGRQIVNKIDAGAVDAYKRWRREETKIRDVTLRHDLYSLSKFFRWAMARNYSRKNPVKLVAIPSDAGAERIYVVSSAEERAYFQHARGALRDVPGIMLEQGCAPMEILSLRKADVDLETGTMKIRMTQISGKRPARARTIYLTPNTKTIGSLLECCRRGPNSNRRIEVLQASALPVSYRATSGGPWPMGQPPSEGVSRNPGAGDGI